MQRRAKQVILLVGDVVTLYLSLWLALRVRHFGGFDVAIFNKHVPVFTFIFFIWILMFFIFGLYSLNSVWSTTKILRGFVGAMMTNTAVAVLFFYLVPFFGITPKTILFLQLGIFTVLFLVWRILYSEALRAIGTTSNLILVGTGSAFLELARDIIKSPELGYNLFALFNLSGKPIPNWVPDSGVLVGRNLPQLKKIISGGEINTVVVSNELYPKIFSSLYQILPTGADFYNLASFWEELNRSIPITEANEIWFLDNLRGVRKRIYEVRKRGFDIAASLILGGFSLLLLPFIVLGIKLSGEGPILYTQKRVGKDGRVFKIVKFRTMVLHAEKNGAQWATKNDPRVTKFGRFLRVTRLDELPQLLNVMKGSMSFIGPRPERPEFVEELSKKIPHYNLRHLIRPGLSGWAQVNFPYGSSDEDAGKKLRYDLYYLKNRSLLLDVEIALKTIGVIIGRKGI